MKYLNIKYSFISWYNRIIANILKGFYTRQKGMKLYWAGMFICMWAGRQEDIYFAPWITVSDLFNY